MSQLLDDLAALENGDTYGCLDQQRDVPRCTPEFAIDAVNFLRTYRAEIRRNAEDSARLDYLDKVAARTLVLGKKVWSVTSDMHLGNRTVSLYVRTGIGSECESQGHGQTVRAAIDDAARAQEGV